MRRATAITTFFIPRGPYSLAVSARGCGDRCRRFRNGVLTLSLEIEGRIEIAQARQLADGRIAVSATSEHAIELVCFQLSLDDDHSEFIRRFADDKLLGPSIRALRGLRPLHLATVAHALVRSLCGQLISAREALALEGRIVRRVSVLDSESGLYSPPTQTRLAAVSPAELCRLGLAPKRAAALSRLCRGLDLESLRQLPREQVYVRLGRERMIGPWSLGVLALQGIGDYRQGLIGDLNLIKLCSVFTGRRASEADSEELLSRYNDWAGLASVYLLRGMRRGLVPLPRGSVDLEVATRALRARARRETASPGGDVLDSAR